MEITAERLTVRRGDTLALEGVSLALPPRGRVLVVGRAGSGKTTLLKTLAGLLPPTAGGLLWQGAPVQTLSSDERRAHQARFGMVFQTDALFDSESVLENVLLPLRRRRVPEEEAQRRAREMLEEVGLGAALHQRTEVLSGGMRKRVGIARAVVASPAVLFADDPLAGLDPRTAREVCSVLAAHAGGRALVVATTEPLPAGALSFDRWWVLSAGRLIHDGPPAPHLLDAPDPPLGLRHEGTP